MKEELENNSKSIYKREMLIPKKKIEKKKPTQIQIRKFLNEDFLGLSKFLFVTAFDQKIKTGKNE